MSCCVVGHGLFPLSINRPSPHSDGVALADGKNDGASDCVREVVVRARRVVDRVATTPGGATLEAHELGDEARIVRQLDLAAVLCR